jgi:hypothetical protein
MSGIVLACVTGRVLVVLMVPATTDRDCAVPTLVTSIPLAAKGLVHAHTGLVFVPEPSAPIANVDAIISVISSRECVSHWKTDDHAVELNMFTEKIGQNRATEP